LAEQQQKVIWCISKYALPPEIGAQGRLIFLSNEFAKVGNKSYVITSSTNHLAKELPRQIEPIHLQRINESTIAFIKGSTIDSAISWKRVFSWIIFEWRLFKLIINRKNRLDKPDVVIVSSLSLLTVINGWLMKKLYKCKFFFEVRDIWPLSAVSVTGYSKYHPIIGVLRMVEKFGYRKADHIFSTLPNLSEHVRNSIKKPFKFTFVPQGYDPNFFSHGQKLLPEFVEKSIPKNKFIVGYIGNIAKAYNIDHIAESAIKMAAIDPDVHFLILGDGPQKETLVQRYGSMSNLSFLPKISKHYVQDFLSYCDVATISMFPEKVYKYGLSPQKLIDYMYAARPVLIAFSGYKTFVEECDCGITVEGNNTEAYNIALQKLKALSPQQREAMGQRGRSFMLTNLSWEELSKRYTQYF
jgi:glycosyltransferase involved in cell wall biosynthesis